MKITRHQFFAVLFCLITLVPAVLQAQTYCNPTNAITAGNPFITSRIFKGVTYNSIGSDFSSDRYVDYTSQVSQSAKRGENTGLNIGLLNCGNSTSFRLRIWVDWNGDGDFTDNGETVASVAETIPAGNCWFQTYFNSFEVPLSGISDGNKRVRVAVARGTSYPTPCGGFTGETEDYNLQILPNSAPVLDNSGTPVFNALTTSQTNNSGQTIESLLISTRPQNSEITYITDADDPSIPHGLAIFRTNAPNGTWQYQLEGSNSWSNFPAVSASNALGLWEDDRIRFVPSGTGNASISFRAWDGTFGSRGGTFSIGATGGNSAFSTATDQATLLVSNSTGAEVFLMDFANDQLKSSSILPNSNKVAGFGLEATNGDAFGNAYEIAHKSGTLYWTNGSGKVFSRAVTGGSNQELVSGLATTLGIDASDNNLFYSDYNGPTTTGTLYKSGLNGSSPSTLATNLGLVWSVAYHSDNNRVYFIDQGSGTPAIKWVSANGGSPTVFQTGTGTMRGLEILDGHVYWVEYTGNDFLTIFKKPISGGSASVVTSVSNQPLTGFDIEFDIQNSQIYVLLQNYLIGTVPLSGGTLTNANTFGQNGTARAFVIINPDGPVCGVPVINCPVNINVNSDPGQCQKVVTYSAPVGTSNCPNPTTTRTAGLASGSAFPVGVTTVTYQVTDANNTSADCSFTVTVNDNENPTANCPATQTVSNDAGECGANVNFPLLSPVDNCPRATSSANPSSGSFFNVGTTQPD